MPCLLRVFVTAIVPVGMIGTGVANAQDEATERFMEQRAGAHGIQERFHGDGAAAQSGVGS